MNTVFTQWLGARLAFYRREFDPSLQQFFSVLKKRFDSNETLLVRVPEVVQHTTLVQKCATPLVYTRFVSTSCTKLVLF